MSLVDFTTFDDVRAALGVSSDEIEDSTLSLDVYEFNLLAELEEIHVSLASAIDTVRRKGEDERSDPEMKLFRAAHLFSTYSVARHLTSALPLFSPKEITDGKASVNRYSQDPYKKVIQKVEDLYDRYRTRLAEVYAAYTAGSTTSVQRTLFTKATPASDPVTGA